MLVLLEIFPESKPRIILEQKVEGHFIYNNYEFNLQNKQKKKVVQLVGQFYNFFQV